jgi:hypothetical protein
MKNLSDTPSSKEQNQVESGRQEAEPVADATLVELGKVSDTQGGWVGPKPDTGAGFAVY